eukprot:m.255931 g.255931  ORF g.255931 m.255931 type:complete len:70 (-) comp15512_c0_seq1:1447-1656(-)
MDGAHPEKQKLETTTLLDAEMQHRLQANLGKHNTLHKWLRTLCVSCAAHGLSFSCNACFKPCHEKALRI